MPLPVVNVTVVLREQDGDPIVGATVTARTDINDIYESFVVPNLEPAVTDGTGTAVLQCFPNKPVPDGLGLTGSTYRFKAVNVAGRKVLDVLAQVPNQACFLHEIAPYEPLPGVFAVPGPAGAAGPDGDSAYEVAVANGFVGTEAAWLASLVGPTGPQGVQGPQGIQGPQGPLGETGPTGAGLTVLGELADPGDLPGSGSLGDAYMIAGHLWTWSGTTWVDAGEIQGPPGADGTDGTDGTDGREIEVQKGTTHIQWRYVGDSTWIDLVTLADITGPQGDTGSAGADGTDGVDGSSVELQVSATHIQWRYVGDSTWIDLVALSAITGPQGEQGIQGETGPAGPTTWAGITDKPDVIIEGDSRLTDSRTPSGGAGGVLSGTYPNPGFAVDMATQGELDAVAAAKLNATNPVVTGTITEDVYAITDGASVDIDPSNGSIQTWTLGASRSPTATSFAAGQSVILMVTAGANAVTWPSVTWSKVGGSGAAPSLTATGATCVILWKVGSTLYGSLLGSV